MVSTETLDAAYLPASAFSVNPCSHPLYYRDVIHGTLAEPRCFSCGSLIDKYSQREYPETD